MRKHAELVLVHVAIGSAYGVKFSTAAWVTTVTDCRGNGAGSKGFREENTTLVKIEVFVGNMGAQVAHNPGFDGVSCRTPFVSRRGKDLKAARVGEVEFHCFNVDGHVSGSINICIKWGEGFAGCGCIRWRGGSINGRVISHGVV
jgi:hypothetical protein